MTKEEAIEVYKGLINTKIKEAFEFFAPELAESEDERIRKELVAVLEDLILPADQRKRFLTYLEKQKEQTADNQFPPLEGLDAIKAKYYDKGFKCGFDEGIDSAKPAEWSKEDEKNRRNLMSLLANMRGDRITEETYQKYYPWLKSLRPYKDTHFEIHHKKIVSLYNDLKKFI